jgi:aryl-alcohol dehydrogenase-like predicted oxidoreductase
MVSPPEQEASVSKTYFTLGRTGLRVSRLALGTMTFGTDWGWGAAKDAAREIFGAYVEAGGNFFDTADLYVGGVAETWLGEFVAERKLRDRAVIVTKASFNADPGNPNGGGNGRKHITRAVEGSLRRLGTDRIDLFIAHVWDRITPAEELMRTLDDLVRAGKVLHVGLSNFPAWYVGRAQAMAELRGFEPISALQYKYSLIDRGIEDEFVPFGTEHGAGILAWSPLASGLLSGKYRAGGGEGRLHVLEHPAFPRLADARNDAITAELEQVAALAGRSMSQVALNWVANRPGVASVLLGATKLAQLQDNLAALDFTLAPELAARLDAASATPPAYPYDFFAGVMQGAVHGGARIGGKPSGYRPEVLIETTGASVSA